MEHNDSVYVLWTKICSVVYNNQKILKILHWILNDISLLIEIMNFHNHFYILHGSTYLLCCWDLGSVGRFGDFLALFMCKVEEKDRPLCKHSDADVRGPRFKSYCCLQHILIDFTRNLSYLSQSTTISGIMICCTNYC